MAFYIYYYIIIILSSNQNDLLFLARGNGEKAERHRERAQLLQGKEMSRKGTLHLVHLRGGGSYSLFLRYRLHYFANNPQSSVPTDLRTKVRHFLNRRPQEAEYGLKMIFWTYTHVIYHFRGFLSCWIHFSHVQVLSKNGSHRFLGSLNSFLASIWLFDRRRLS